MLTLAIRIIYIYYTRSDQLYVDTGYTIHIISCLHSDQTAVNSKYTFHNILVYSWVNYMLTITIRRLSLHVGIKYTFHNILVYSRVNQMSTITIRFI